MLNPGSALLTLSYLGAERAIPNYNVMGLAKASLEANVRYMANAMGPEGVRVNAISAGPIRTLAASGIKDFRKMLAHCEAVTLIRRTVTIEEWVTPRHSCAPISLPVSPVKWSTLTAVSASLQ